MQAHDGPVTMELEHAIGYLAIDNGLFYHPNARDIVYSAGGTVIVCDLNDPHAQSILIGHDANVTCLALSRGGRLIASGQHGENADAIVWNFEARKELYRLSEHDHGIQVSPVRVLV
jgi:WD40 repeat protein